MSPRKHLVETYFEGFGRSNHETILACLTDDVVWDLPGFKHLEGKDAFDGEIENDAFEGSPSLGLDRLIEERDTVVALGSGRGRRSDGEAFRLAFSDVFTFRGELICRVESYLVALTEPAPERAS